MTLKSKFLMILAKHSNIRGDAPANNFLPEENKQEVVS